jgi:peptide/nickel transport system substrate-binding protein
VAEELVSLLTHATLVRVNRVTGVLEARLARDWTTSPDGLTWTIRLREGVTFSDGKPFTAADVVFTLRALYDPRVNSAMATALRIAGRPLTARAMDDHTVVIIFPAPYGPGLSVLDSLPILPSHLLQAALDAGTFRDAWGVTTPPDQIAGLGPFMIQEYRAGERLTFTRNPHFWGRDADGRTLPYLDQIELQIVPEQNAEMLRLEAGEVELTTSEARSEDMATLKPLEARGALQLVAAGVTISPDVLWFNLTPGASSAKGRPWLQNADLRRAISFAVDRQAIVNTVYLGAAEPAWGPITSSHGEWFLPDLPKTDFNANQSRALLGSLGLTDRNGDGMLEDSAGKPARFSILTQKGQTIRERTVAMLQEQLRRVGLAVDVVAVEQGAIFQHYGDRDYDAIYFWAPSDATDPARNLDFWLSSGSFHFWNPEQKTPATPWEAKIDDLMRKQSTAVDPVERRRLFAEVQRTLAGELPVLYFAAPKVFIAMSARVHGATPSVLSPSVLWNAEVLSVTPAGGAARK